MTPQIPGSDLDDVAELGEWPPRSFPAAQHGQGDGNPVLLEPLDNR